VLDGGLGGRGGRSRLRDLGVGQDGAGGDGGRVGALGVGGGLGAVDGLDGGDVVDLVVLLDAALWGCKDRGAYGSGGLVGGDLGRLVDGSLDSRADVVGRVAVGGGLDGSGKAGDDGERTHVDLWWVLSTWVLSTFVKVVENECDRRYPVN
jgi:hypothetical protein